MPNLRMIRRRISAVTSIQQVTGAMQMIAASRVRKAQEQILQTRPYAQKLEGLMSHMASQIAQGDHPLVTPRPVEHATLIVVTADRGLCRAFNSNVIRRATERRNDLVAQGATVDLITVGRKSTDHFNRRSADYPIVASHAGIFQSLKISTAQEIAAQAVELYRTRTTDHVEVIYNEFKNMLQQDLIVKQFLPLCTVVPSDDSEGSSEVDYIYEPDLAAIWDRLVSQYLDLEIWRVLLESSAAELAARMTAMEEATDNAADMIKSLISVRNKVRQATITQELSEIVGGSDALE
jgi:F-type H+-transporting ATPase subunit gamma